MVSREKRDCLKVFVNVLPVLIVMKVVPKKNLKCFSLSFWIQTVEQKKRSLQSVEKVHLRLQEAQVTPYTTKGIKRLKIVKIVISFLHKKAISTAIRATDGCLEVTPLNLLNHLNKGTLSIKIDMNKVFQRILLRILTPIRVENAIRQLLKIFLLFKKPSYKGRLEMFFHPQKNSLKLEI